MPETEDPHRREELLSAFGSVHQEASELFASLPAEDFFRRPGDGVWSPAENVIHLIKSVKAVARGLELPRLVLRLRFGTAKGSRSYSEVREIYLEALGKGAVASGPFVPVIDTPEDSGEASRARSRALSGWQAAGASLVDGLGKWSEGGLDRYRLPHPLLGKLTVREMLFFTHYHDLHHIENVRRATAGGGAD